MGLRYSCRICNFQTIYRGSLVQHQKSAHEAIKYPCKECDYQATQKGHLSQHQKSAHKGIKYPCKECNYQATQKGHLNRHQKSAHEATRKANATSRDNSLMHRQISEKYVQNEKSAIPQHYTL